MNMQCFGALDEKLVSELESKLGVTLTESYRDFLKKTGDGVVKQDGSNKVLIPAINQTIAVDVFFDYGVSKNSDMVENPGPLADMDSQPAKNFFGGRYNEIELTEDTVLYRAGNADNPFGQWFTKEAPKSVAQVRIDTAVKPK